MLKHRNFASITSIKIIEQFLEKGDPKLRDWAKLALQEG